ncbi:MAG: carbohydrate kinase [Candidatus Omnitrophica bacterium]|nr:carbohydrate kinase [Candidatus Omnitrophota bacterium]
MSPTDILFLGGTSIDLIQEHHEKNKNLHFKASVGGSITNSAVISAKLGLKTVLLSRVGFDTLGEFAVKFLNSTGVKAKNVTKDPNIRTSLAIASIDKHGDSKYTFYKNSPKDSIIALKNAPKAVLSTCKIFHFGSSLSYQDGATEEILKYIRFLKKRKVFISFDPNFRPYAIKNKKQARKKVFKFLKLVDLAKLSEVDLKFLTREKSIPKGLKILKNKFKCEIIVTLGPKGSVYPNPSLRGARRRSNLNLIKIPALKVKIANTIGAGDAYTAGILYKIAKKGEKEAFKDIKSTMAFATTIATQSLTSQNCNALL